MSVVAELRPTIFASVVMLFPLTTNPVAPLPGKPLVLTSQSYPVGELPPAGAVHEPVAVVAVMFDMDTPVTP